MSPTSHPSHSSPEIFTFPIRVYYEDTDAIGIVYHANYVNFAERARTEYLRSTGWNHERLEKEMGLALVVRHIEIDYHASARVDDLLEVRTHITEFGNTSFTMEQKVYRGDKLLAKLKVVLVAITEGKAVRLPPQLRQIFGEK